MSDKHNDLKKKPSLSELGEISQYLSLLFKLGGTMAISLMTCLAIGIVADRYLSTNGILILVGILLGVCCGFIGIWSILNKLK